LRKPGTGLFSKRCPTITAKEAEEKRKIKKNLANMQTTKKEGRKRWGKEKRSHCKEGGKS